MRVLWDPLAKEARNQVADYIRHKSVLSIRICNPNIYLFRITNAHIHYVRIINPNERGNILRW